MNREKLAEHMMSELDWHAREYQKYTDIEVKEEIAAEFKTIARAYNALMKSVYKRGYRSTFTSKIERHIEQRNGENWK